MRRLSCVLLLVGAASALVALVASAAPDLPRGTKIVRVAGPIVALALDGRRAAYDVGLTSTTVKGRLVTHPNTVRVWNLHTGKTTKVSGRFTAGWAECEYECDFDLAIAGSRVAWLFFGYGNTEEDDYLLNSSLAKPKERHVATYKRFGDGCGASESEGVCAGTRVWGLVGAGDHILIRRMTTDDSGTVTDNGLYEVSGTHLKRLGTATGTPIAADPQRVALLQPDGTIAIYSTTGTPLLTVTPAGRVLKAGLSGRNLVVLEWDKKRTWFALYDARTGELRKTFSPRWMYFGAAVAVYRNVAVYSRLVVINRRHRESAIRAINLSSGKDRLVVRLRGDIGLAAIDSVGLVYASVIDNRNARLAFLPFKRVAAAVS